VALPYTKVSGKRIDCRFQGRNYAVEIDKGTFSVSGDRKFRIAPAEGMLMLNLAKR
jgi:hypothetical protein